MFVWINFMHIPKYKKEKKINMKKAIIFGVTGQTGSYLAKLLIQKNYYVYLYIVN